MQIAINAGYSLLAPFFPVLGFERDGNYTLVGIVFSTQAATNFIFTFVFGKFLKRIGKRELVFVSLILFFIGNAAFGAIIFLKTK